MVLKFRTTHYLIALFIAATAPIAVVTPAHADPIPTASPWTGSPLPGAQIYAQSNNALSTFRDSAGCDSSTVNPQIDFVTRSSGNDYTTYNSTNGWAIRSCARLRTVSTDDTVYYVEYSTSNATKRITAKKDSTIKWQYTFNVSGCNYATSINDLVMGFDGNIYSSVSYTTNCGSSSNVKLISLSVANGNKRYESALPSSDSSVLASSTITHELFPYSGGIAVLNNKLNIYYYSYGGTLDSSKTFTPYINGVVPTPQSVSVDQTGRAYIIAWSGSTVKALYKDINSATVHELIPSVGSANAMNIYAAPNNTAVIRWRQNSQWGFSYFNSDDSQRYSLNLQYDGSESLASSSLFMGVDNSGNVITTRVMNSGSQRLVYTDSFSPVSGTKTRLFNSDSYFNTSSSDQFAVSTFTADSIGENKIYLVMCNNISYTSSGYCRDIDSPKVVTIPSSTNYEYNRSNLLNALNTDSDGDGLTVAQEALQNTSDNNIDSDNDGLRDDIESVNYTNRDFIFCNPSTGYCEYPTPDKKDLYIETDWMTKPANSGFTSNTYSTKLSSSQISSIKQI
jgi:hypothetical protein